MLDGAEIDRIARVVHEAVRAWAKAHDDASLPPWDKAEQWMIDSTRAAVVFRLDNPKAKASAQHDQWMAERRSAGWKHGAVKDAEKKTHPMLVPYKKLPLYERQKDALVGAVVGALTKKI